MGLFPIRLFGLPAPKLYLFMKDITKYIFFSFLLFAACDIIQDTDLLTQEELENLNLRTIGIEQDLRNGFSKASFELLYDSTISVIDNNTGTLLTRLVSYKIPALGQKLKYRSGASSNLKCYIYYTSSGQPYTFGILQADTVVERYRFRYDANGRLNNIRCFAYTKNEAVPIWHRYDSIVYNGSEISTIYRGSATEPEAAGIFTIEYTGSGAFRNVGRVAFGNMVVSNQGGNCPNNSGNNCRGYVYQINTPNSGTFNVSSLTFLRGFSFEKLSFVQFADTKINNFGGVNCCYDYDTYYFHPMMLLREEFQIGDDLFPVYLIDWWIPGQQIGNNASYQSNEAVTLTFNYAP